LICTLRQIIEQAADFSMSYQCPISFCLTIGLICSQKNASLILRFLQPVSMCNIQHSAAQYIEVILVFWHPVQSVLHCIYKVKLVMHSGKEICKLVV
jgi:hypothetical protein